jgi:polar amino acid transport system substrate-binding protein
MHNLAQSPENRRMVKAVCPVTRAGRILFALIASLSAAAAFAQSDASQQPRTELRIATEGAYPPFNFVDTDGQLKGFEIDLARALCERINATCIFVQTDWESLLPDLRRSQVDAVVASLEITEERRQKIAFTQRYYRTPAVFMVRQGSPLSDVSPTGLKGRRLGAMAGTVYATYLEELYKAGSEIKLYANQDEASLDLALDRIDAVLGDKIALQEWLNRGKEAHCCRFLANAPSDPLYFGEGYGIGLRKGETALRKRLDQAIEDIQADGTYEAIRTRYFPFDVR